MLKLFKKFLIINYFLKIIITLYPLPTLQSLLHFKKPQKVTHERTFFLPGHWRMSENEK